MSKILIIEDDEDILESTRDLLEEEGYSVSTAENGLTRSTTGSRSSPRPYYL